MVALFQIDHELKPPEEHILVMNFQGRLLHENVIDPLHLRGRHLSIGVDQHIPENLQPAPHIFEMRKEMRSFVLVSFDGVRVEIAFFDDRVRESNVVLHVINQDGDEVLVLDEVAQEVLPGPLSCWVLTRVHLFDQFLRDLEVLKRKFLARDVIDGLTHINFLDGIFPVLNSLAELLPRRRSNNPGVFLIQNSNGPQEIGRLLHEAVWRFSELVATFLAEFRNQLDVLLDEVGRIDSLELVDKVLLGLVGHRDVRNFKDVEDDLVDFKFDVDMSEFVANGPDQVDFLRKYHLFTKE